MWFAQLACAPSRSGRSRTPTPSVQMKLRWTPLGSSATPAAIVPSAETPRARVADVFGGAGKSSKMPFPSTHRTACFAFPAISPDPTMTDPSPEAASAMLSKPPPGKSPRPIMPVPALHLNASAPLAETLQPVTTDPSPEILPAALKTASPGRSPTPVNEGGAASAECPRTQPQTPTAPMYLVTNIHTSLTEPGVESTVGGSMVNRFHRRAIRDASVFAQSTAGRSPAPSGQGTRSWSAGSGARAAWRSPRCPRPRPSAPRRGRA